MVPEPLGEWGQGDSRTNPELLTAARASARVSLKTYPYRYILRHSPPGLKGPENVTRRPGLGVTRRPGF
jgi:hypothetical protein